MKNKHYYFGLLSFIILSFCFTSCKKYLEEDLTTEHSTEYYKTEQSIKVLTVGAYYQVFCSPFASEWIYCATNYGTDEFHLGGDPSNSMWNSYDNRLKSIVNEVNGNTAASHKQWDNLYTGISDANMIIQNAKASESTNADIKKTALGSGYFFRAYNYLRLVSQYGAVPLKLEPSTSVEFEFTRDSVEKVYKQIISDFRNAYNLLPSSVSNPGRLDK